MALGLQGIVQWTVRTPPGKPCGTKRSGVSHSWYDDPISEGTVSVTLFIMTTTLIGYARCSTDKQDLAAQRAACESAVGFGADQRDKMLKSRVTHGSRACADSQ